MPPSLTYLAVTVPTTWTDQAELPDKEMTPLEIAKHLGSQHLYDLLTPQVYHILPIKVSIKLESQLHAFLMNDLSQYRETAHLALPELQTLQCLKTPEMWFPVHYPDRLVGNNNANQPKLYVLNAFLGLHDSP